MMKAIARRIKRLEDFELQNRPESELSLVDVVLERRRKRAIAEGREPEPDPPPKRAIDSSGRALSLADILLQNRRTRG